MAGAGHWLEGPCHSAHRWERTAVCYELRARCADNCWQCVSSANCCFHFLFILLWFGHLHYRMNSCPRKKTQRIRLYKNKNKCCIRCRTCYWHQGSYKSNNNNNLPALSYFIQMVTSWPSVPTTTTSISTLWQKTGGSTVGWGNARWAPVFIFRRHLWLFFLFLVPPCSNCKFSSLLSSIFGLRLCTLCLHCVLIKKLWNDKWHQAESYSVVST